MMPFKDPKKMAEYMRKRRSESKKVNKVNVNPVNPKRKPVNHKARLTQTNVNPLTQSVNPQNERYLLSFSRNKYQYVLYSVDSSGTRSLIRSCRKNEVLKLGPCEIELTWGPEVEVKE
jgi:hypothetical protein